MNRVVIAGGSGFIGQILAEHFENHGKEVIILTRKKNDSQIKFGHPVFWDAQSLGSWVNSLESAQAVINLCGKSVDCRYTRRNKGLIYSSRLDSTRVIGEAIKGLKQPPKVWINSSSATIYRHAEDRRMDEYTGEIGTGFSVDVCQQWEKTLLDSNCTIRKVALRSSLVLGKSGSVFAAFKDLARKGLMGTQGSGSQFVSWIHEKDFIHAIDFIIQNESISEAINICAPNPVTNKYFMQSLRSSLGTKFGLRTHAWMAKIGALFLGTEAELILKSRNVVPTRLIENGFEFDFPYIDDALSDLAQG